MTAGGVNIFSLLIAIFDKSKMRTIEENFLSLFF